MHAFCGGSARLAKGARLLGALLPSCSRSVLGHTHVVVVVPHAGGWTRKGSCSDFRIGGTIFVNREMLHNPWWVADRLLHESLHQKLYDFRQTHSLLAGDLAPESSAPKGNAAAVHAIWNPGGETRSNCWDTFRAVAAFHVYVHLAVFCAQAERRKEDLVKRFGETEASFPTMTKRREALERAQYLGRNIRGSCWQELGPAGRLLVDWLMAVLNAIDPTPPPPDSPYMHLLLHRYLMEALMLVNEKRSPEHTAHLPQLIDEEAGTMRRVLSAIDPEDRTWIGWTMRWCGASARQGKRPSCGSGSWSRRSFERLLPTVMGSGVRPRLIQRGWRRRFRPWWRIQVGN